MTSSVTIAATVTGRALAGVSMTLTNLALTACADRTDAVAVPVGWKLVDTGPFSFYAPPDLHKANTGGVAVDSFVGEFESKGLYVIFDYGLYSSSLTGPINAHFRTHTEIVGGRPATLATFIVETDSPQQRYKDMVAIYFADTGKRDERLNMSAQCADLWNCQDAMDMFRSIRFADRRTN